MDIWAIGVYDLGLPPEWMEHFTLEEYQALKARHHEKLHVVDLMHARTAQSMRGGDLNKLLLFRAPQEPHTRKPPPTFAEVCLILGAQRRALN